MGYSGAKLSTLLTTAPIPRACRGMADEGGKRQTAAVIRNTPVDTRYLRENITQKLVVVYFSADHGTWVYESGSETNVEYAPYVEHGTGLWGPSGAYYEIRPKRPDGWLSWIDAITGERIFAKRVMHPGSPGNHMFAIGVAISEHEFEQFSRAHVTRWARECENHWRVQAARQRPRAA